MKRVILILMVLGIMAGNLYSQVSSLEGSGTELDPYLVQDLQDLITISENSSIWDKHFLQTADIDASSTSELNEGAGFSPIGSFSGTYDGQRNTIYDLYINRPGMANVGLFGKASGSIISNVGLVNNEIIGNSSVGSLIGDAYPSSTVNKCYATGSVSGYRMVGGLIGNNQGYSPISDSYATGSVSGTERVGGLVGNSYSSAINNCYATGAVNGINYIGGLVGYRSGGSVANSFWDMETTGQTTSQGGIGKTTQAMKDPDTYVNAGWDFNTWVITSGTNLGYPAFLNNYIRNMAIPNNAINVTLTPTISFEVDENYLYYELYFGDSPNPETPIINYNSVTNLLSYTFTEPLEYLTDYYWMVNLYDTNYEVTTLSFTFKTRPEFDGSGTQADPYQIATINDLIFVSEHDNFWNKHYIQTTDIDASSTTSLNEGAGFSPIGNNTTNFTGSYNGNGHTISNLKINRSYTNYVGLFGRTEGANISNVGLVNNEIIGNNNVGSLVGYSASSITRDSYVTGSVNGNNYVGGLIGYSNYSSINHSYVTGLVNGTSNVGGLVGYRYGGSVTNSFWNLETTGQTTSQGGLGKTIQEMRDIYTYLTAGWDFVNEFTNGTANIWYLHSNYNSGYPIFANQHLVIPLYPLHQYPANGVTNLPLTDNLLWESDYLQIITGYRLYLGTDNPPTNGVNNQDLGLTNSFEYSNLSPNTTYYWQVIPYNEAGCAEDCSIWSFTTGTAEVISVGSGVNSNASLPINFNYQRSYSQTIYLQSDINLVNRNIQKVAFYTFDDFDLMGANQWKVYLGHTDKTEFSTNNDWLFANQGLTEVANITLDEPLSEGWVEIELTVPFAYNNVDNLIVGLLEYSPGIIEFPTNFYTTETNSNRTLIFGHDTVIPNPNIPYNGIISTSTPKIKFTFSEPLTRFTGLVQSSQNQALANANVYIEGFGTFPTNSLGEFNVHNIEAGTYQLTVSAPWYETQTIEFEVIEGQDNYLEITLLEDLLPASSLTATLAEDLTNVELTWTQPTLARVTDSSNQARRSLSQAMDSIADKQSSEQRTGQPDLVYNLYRYLAGDEASPDNWLEVATNLDALTYSDTSFPSLDLGSYYWAVQAVYSNDRLAEASISNEILKQPNIASNIEAELDFGTIYLTNASEYQEVIITNIGTGPLTIDEITSTETAFNLIYDSADFNIEPNTSMTIEVNFEPESPGLYVSDLVISNNSTTEPNFTLTLRGLCEYIPPANPDGVQVTLVNNTAQISWEPVTEDVYENPISPDLYIIYFNGLNTQDDNHFYYLGATNQLSYSHINVGAFSEFMFYRVKAYVDVDNAVLNHINDLVSQKRKVSLKEVESLISNRKGKAILKD